MRSDVEKYNGRVNFGLWQAQVKYMLIQFELYKALKGISTHIFNGDSSKTSKVHDEEYENLDLRVENLIPLCLAKNALANVHISMTKDI